MNVQLKSTGVDRTPTWLVPALFDYYSELHPPRSINFDRVRNWKARESGKLSVDQSLSLQLGLVGMLCKARGVPGCLAKYFGMCSAAASNRQFSLGTLEVRPGVAALLSGLEVTPQVADVEFCLEHFR